MTLQPTEEDGRVWRVAEEVARKVHDALMAQADASDCPMDGLSERATNRLIRLAITNHPNTEAGTRLRAATQRIIERIGAVGPENLESAVERLITRLDAYRESARPSASERSMPAERLGDIEFAVAYVGADCAPKMSGNVHKMLRDCLVEMGRLRALVGEWKASQARAVDAELAAREALVSQAKLTAVARRDAILEAAGWLNAKHPEAADALASLGNSCVKCRVWPCACAL